jgi:hypothetical protein
MGWRSARGLAAAAALAAALGAGARGSGGGDFVATDPLGTGGRTSHAAARLADGRVLVVGGYNATIDAAAASAELYDPAAGTFSGTGSLSQGRIDTTADLLPDGRVLVAGGIASGTAFASTEIFSPGTGSFAAGPSMGEARAGQVTVPLADGRLLAVGGYAAGGSALASAEIYDPASGADGAWSSTGSMAVRRLGHSAVLLADGRVLVIGGASGSEGGFASHSSCEIYDPVAGTFSGAASLPAGRAVAAAALLPDGSVLLVGGGAGSTSHHGALRYDPVADSWSSAGTTSSGGPGLTLTALPDGRLLAAGGASLPSQAESDAADLYDPAAGTFEALDPMVDGRNNHTATLLADGRVLLVAGSRLVSAGIGGAISAAELFVPAPPGDGEAPVVAAVSATPALLWPPNHQMVSVAVSALVTDDEDPTPVVRIVSIESDEPEDGDDDGSTSPDAEITGDLTANLRAERSGTGDGRVYTITVVAEDDAGNETLATVAVSVPLSRGK